MASPPAGGPMAIAMRLRNQLQAVYKMDPLRNEEEVKVKMKELNEHIVCFLCAGYFIDATTITECLHTFCKSCIVKFLQTSKYCPLCSTKIHETQPLLNLKLDRVMQDVVYKLVPGLQESEERRIREFYQSRGLERGSQASHEDPASDRVGLPYTTFDHSRAHYYRFDEHVTLCLEKQRVRRFPGGCWQRLPFSGRLSCSHTSLPFEVGRIQPPLSSPLAAALGKRRANTSCSKNTYAVPCGPRSVTSAGFCAADWNWPCNMYRSCLTTRCFRIT
ncbi:polycomb group RING finger protein 1 isoform X1 [Crotalus tigris]|uniref:polycomb group RING finger protein 1 isoform X1 n=1 Tax=Crotalus tigris TaxID=88082 RepID=UPI00192F8667|nr:polycomb group RING finger protein 1 isoform X1 [Crotalus tigris]